MRILLTSVIALSLSACVSPYQGPSTGDVAFITVPKTKSGFTLNDLFSTLNVGIGDFNADGCMPRARLVKERSLNEEGKVVVPAGREIGFFVSSIQGNSGCGVGIAVTLSPGKTYQMKYEHKARYCYLGLTEDPFIDGSTPIEAVKLDKLCKP